MPDHPRRAIARDGREPLPFRPAAAGCAFSVHAFAGQWDSCGGRPAFTGVWTGPGRLERWRAFACGAHGDRLEGPEWSAVGPLDKTAIAELADRRERWQAALDGKGWRPPQPMEPRRPGRRL